MRLFYANTVGYWLPYKIWQDEIHDKQKQIYEKPASLSCQKNMIDKKTAKRFERLLKILKEEDNNIKERARQTNKIRENTILRSLEDREDKEDK
jgi:ActR/RegA family two-component response regulator